MAELFGRFWVWKEPQCWDRWRALRNEAWSHFALGLFRYQEFLLTRSWSSKVCRPKGVCQLSNHSATSIVLAYASACLYLTDRSNLAVEASAVRQRLDDMVLILKTNWPRKSCAFDFWLASATRVHQMFLHAPNVFASTNCSFIQNDTSSAYQACPYERFAHQIWNFVEARSELTTATLPLRYDVFMENFEADLQCLFLTRCRHQNASTNFDLQSSRNSWLILAIEHFGSTSIFHPCRSINTKFGQFSSSRAILLAYLNCSCMLKGTISLLNLLAYTNYSCIWDDTAGKSTQQPNQIRIGRLFCRMYR